MLQGHVNLSTPLTYRLMNGTRIDGHCNGHAVEMSSPKPYEHRFCVVTRVFNYAEWLPEWIEYHNLLGASKFFITDDCSTDGGHTMAILEYYRDLGLVEIVKAPEAYCETQPRKPDERMLINRLWGVAKQSGCDWIGIFDVDEFIAFTGDAWQEVDSMYPYFDKYPFPVIKMGWWCVGSSGKEKKSDGLQIENFNTGDTECRNRDTHSKSIYRSQVTDSYGHPHFSMNYSQNYECVRTLGDQYNPDGQSDVIEVTNQEGKKTRIYQNSIILKHFVYRSWEEYVRGRGNLTVDASNRPNVWSAKNKQAWLEGAIPNSFDPSANFTQRMATRVRHRLATRDLPKTVPFLPNFLGEPTPDQTPLNASNSKSRMLD